MTAKCLGRMLEQAGIGFLYYYGEVSTAKKKKAIMNFKNHEDKKVMVSRHKFMIYALVMNC